MRSAFTLPTSLLAALLAIGSLTTCQRATYALPVARIATGPAAPPEAMVALTPSPEVALPQVPALPARRRSPWHVLARQLAPTWQRQLAPAVKPIAAVVPARLRAQASAATPAPGLPPKQRSRMVAILLAVLAVTYVPLSLHNFYLGYYGRGVAAIGLFVLGSYLLLVGTLGFFTTSGGLAVVGLVGLGLLAGWFAWQLSDLFRIITGSLPPANGEYKQKAVQP